MEKRNIVFAVAAALGVISLPSFLDHFLYFVSGQVNQIVIQQRWDLVLLNIIGFLLFLIPLNYRRKADWKSFGIYTAFIVSLFVEMYGIPLTVYLSSTTFSPSVAAPAYLLEFSLLGQTFGMSFWMLTGAVITTLGMLIVALGWYTVYQKDGLVTSGLYSYSRHPQYLGIVLIAFGWFIGWPTILTTLLFPVLAYTYYNNAKTEEKEMIEEFGEERYEKYREETPLFL